MTLDEQIAVLEEMFASGRGDPTEHGRAVLTSLKRLREIDEAARVQVDVHAEFEAVLAREFNIGIMDLTRTEYALTPDHEQQYLDHETNRLFILFKAVRATLRKGGE